MTPDHLMQSRSMFAGLMTPIGVIIMMRPGPYSYQCGFLNDK
jgi:hypothetical protein